MWLIARKLNSHQLHPLHLDRGITDVILPQATVLIVCQCNSYSINTATVYTLGIFSGIKSWRFDSKRKKTYRRKRLQTANKLRNSRKGFPLLAQKALCLCPEQTFWSWHTWYNRDAQTTTTHYGALHNTPSLSLSLSTKIPTDTWTEYWDIWTVGDHIGHHCLLLLLHLLRLTTPPPSLTVHQLY